MHIEITPEHREAVKRVRSAVEKMSVRFHVTSGLQVEASPRVLGDLVEAQSKLANLVIAAIEEQEQGESSHV